MKIIRSDRFDNDSAAFSLRDAHTGAGLDEVAFADDIETDTIELCNSGGTQCCGGFPFTSDKHFHVFACDKTFITAFDVVEHHFALCEAALGGTAQCNGNGDSNLALMTFLSGIEVVPFDAAAALAYGSIRADLTKKGNLIGANDMLIAAHAKALDLTLVTNKTREFNRVEGLKIENWV